jgi:hypothetical protein
MVIVGVWAYVINGKLITRPMNTVTASAMIGFVLRFISTPLLAWKMTAHIGRGHDGVLITKKARLDPDFRDHIGAL